MQNSPGAVWHTLGPVIKTDRRTFKAEAYAGADSSWFHGHFPGDPMLPGVAQLALVKAVVAQAAGTSVAVRALSRVRYRRMIRPDDAIKIRVEADPEEQDTYKFKIFANDEVACSGTARIGPTR